ncbi:hypothetical protein R3P38DRAFT_577996 [Favolaschia claudopus]|uniref:Uncharacterized protein n=1 Tax=Favolaschia claudopus TaxID=2862362 RepID=A0AAV9ZAC3_9AGAR
MHDDASLVAVIERRRWMRSALGFLSRPKLQVQVQVVEDERLMEVRVCQLVDRARKSRSIRDEGGWVVRAPGYSYPDLYLAPRTSNSRSYLHLRLHLTLSLVPRTSTSTSILYLSLSARTSSSHLHLAYASTSTSISFSHLHPPFSLPFTHAGGYCYCSDSARAYGLWDSRARVTSAAGWGQVSVILGRGARAWCEAYSGMTVGSALACVGG